MHLRKTLTLLLLLLMVAAQAAPLLPEAEDHWAHDAYRRLVTQGLIESYPDGTFKGDRSISRWELAQLVARVVERMQSEHGTYAARSQLEELRAVAGELNDELAALGVRLTNLEEAVGRLDTRVDELERVTFYGSLQTRVVSQSFTNDGSPGIRGEVPIVDYHSAVGSAVGAGGLITAGPATGLPLVPSVFGVFPLGDFLSGRAFTNGTGFTALAELGLQADITEELEAEVEFAAFTSQGDAIVDSLFGVAAPYLANPYSATADPTQVGQPANNQPFTRMVLDHFKLFHKPSQTQLIVGAFEDPSMSDLMFAGPEDPNLYSQTLRKGFQRLPHYGFRLNGASPLNEDLKLDWELMGTLLPDGNLSLLTGAGYRTHALGADLRLTFDEDRGSVQFNFLRAMNETSGGLQRTGLNDTVNALGLYWVNPPNFFVGNLPGGSPVAGIGSTSDIRPIVGPPGQTDGVTGIPGVLNYGGIGPQEQISYGLSGSYTIDLPEKPRFYFDWAHSDYQPNRNADFSVGGDAWRVGGEATVFGNLKLGLQYLHVDPRYDPFILQYPALAGLPTALIRVRRFDYFPTHYALHDSDQFPHNRQGIRAEATWLYSPQGLLQINHGELLQVESSLPDIRFTANSLGPGLPNSDVFGFTPGFVDGLFTPLSAFTFAPQGNNGLAVPLESPRGRVRETRVLLNHRFPVDEGKNLTFTGLYVNNKFRRSSRLQNLRPGPLGTRGESENLFDTVRGGFFVELRYDLTRDFQVNANYTHLKLTGHIQDPFGVYSDYAEALGNPRLRTVNTEATIPALGFDWKVNEKTHWGLEARFLRTRDLLGEGVVTTPSVPGLNLSLGRTVGSHPFNWSGWQVNSVLKIDF